MTDTTWLDGIEQQSWGTNGGTFTGGPPKGLLHTTETWGWPGYGRGASCPHLTGLPVVAEKRIHWRQHTPLNVAARALRNPAGGVQTNRDGVRQIELIGTCDPAYYARWSPTHPELILWPQAPDWALAGVAEMMRRLESACGIAPVAVDTWLPYPQSYGDSPVRMSRTQWDAFSGWCGHQHAAENVHGDPGDINIAALMPGGLVAVAPAPVAAAPVRPAPLPDLTGTEAGRPAVKLIDLRNAHRTYVRAPGVAPLQRLLGVKADGVGGPDTRNALGAAQTRIGVARDYIFGPDTASGLLAGK